MESVKYKQVQKRLANGVIDAIPISIQCSEVQIEFIKAQVYVHDVVYNTCLMDTYYRYHQTGRIDYANWLPMLQQSLANNPIFPNIFDIGDLRTIYGAMNELQSDLMWHINNNNLKSWPQEKQFDSTFRYYQIDYNQPLSSLHLNELSLPIPALDLVKCDTTLDSNIDQINSKVAMIRVHYNSSTNSCSLTLYTSIIYRIIEDEPNSSSVAIYLGSDPYLITLSNGDTYQAPNSLLSSLYRLKASKDFENSLSDEQKEMQQRMLHVQQKSLENKIINQRNTWFNRVANDIMSKYKLVVFENQPREPGNSIEFPGWIQFISELYNVKKSYPKDYQLINVYKDPRHITTCSVCGSTKLDMVNFGQSEWLCTQCLTKHNTQINTARNILKAGLMRA